MSYQTDLAAIAIAIANSSFSNVAKLARLVAIYGDKKEVKVCWAEVCENNGLASSTSKDYWTLAVAFGFMFTDYQATRDLQVKQTEAKFSDLGITSLKTMKTYKVLASKLLGFESSLKTMRSSNGQNNELENLIKLVTDSKGKTLASLESNLAEVDSYLKALAEKATKDAEKATKDAEKAAKDADADTDADADADADTDTDTDTDADADADTDTDTDTDTDNAAAAMRLHVLTNLTNDELLAVIASRDNNDLLVILDSLQALIAKRQKAA